jgi:BirA family biotin operon repressor/biotin-[acetyl-CoA-carboxylase] ligase
MVVELLSQAWPITRFGEIDSTNEEARRRASDGDAGPCWLTTEVQTAGRGRLGRAWSSPKGNLFATALLPYPRPPAEAALACFSAGLAVLDAARSCGVDAEQAKLKWPNDVLVGPAKLCGILIETGQINGSLWMAAGFGVNVEVAPERPDRPTKCLADLPGGGGADGGASARGAGRGVPRTAAEPAYRRIRAYAGGLAGTGGASGPEGGTDARERPDRGRDDRPGR